MKNKTIKIFSFIIFTSFLISCNDGFKLLNSDKFNFITKTENDSKDSTSDNNDTLDNSNYQDYNSSYRYDTECLYNGKVYKGKCSEGSGHLEKYSTLSSYYKKPNVGITTIEFPQQITFDSDGFFTLKGRVSNSTVNDYLMVTVEKDTGAYDKKATYWLQNNFNDRIWLPFGKGKYTVKIIELTSIILNNKFSSGDKKGSVKGWGYNVNQKNNPLPVYEFHVNNIRNEDGCFLYPSYYIQSDDKTLYNKAMDLTQDKLTKKDKVQAIHDWVCDNFSYDNDSLRDGFYKKQDAVSVYADKIAVCEGYTSIMAAMLRSIGIRVKAMAGKGCHDGHCELHAWNEVEIDNSWYFLDATWDDPIGGSPNNEYNYLYKNIANKTPSDHHPGNLNGNTQDYGSKHGGQRPGRSFVNTIDQVKVTMPMAIEFGY